MSAEAKTRTLLQGENTIKPILSYGADSQLYETPRNLVGPLEDYQFGNEFTIHLDSLDLGDISQAQINGRNFEFISDLVLNITVERKDIGVNDFVHSNMTGYHMIDTFSYKIPGCPKIDEDMRTVPFHFLEQCETREKRNEFTKLSGSHPVLFNERYLSGSLKMQVLLPFPGNSLYGTKQRKMKPFPAHMIKDNIDFYIKWKKASEVGTNVKITEAFISFRYNKVAVPEQLKKSLYRYQYLQGYDHVYDIKDVNNIGRIDLMGWRSGETRELLLLFNPTGNFDQFKSIQPATISLVEGSQEIWKSNFNSLKYQDLLSESMPSSCDFYFDDAVALFIAPIVGILNADILAYMNTFADRLIYFYGDYSVSRTDLVTSDEITFYLDMTNVAKDKISNLDQLMDFLRRKINYFFDADIDLGFSGWKNYGANDAVTAVIWNDFWNYFLRSVLGSKKGKMYWVKIPIADLLERQQKPGDYSSGADFGKKELKLSWTPTNLFNPKGRLLVKQYINSVLSFENGVAKLIQ